MVLRHIKMFTTTRNNMEKLTSLDQLKVGTKLKIVAKYDKYSHKSISVKKIIPMRRYNRETDQWSEPYDHEILINHKNNYYFSMNNYLKGESNWVKEVYVLEGTDKRLKRELRKQNDQV